MNVKNNKESFFWNICYLTVFLDLFIVLFNPIPAGYIFFPKFFIISYFIAVLICFLYVRYNSNNLVNDEKLLTFVKLFFILISIIILIFGAFLVFQSRNDSDFIFTRNKTLLIVVPFVVFTTLSSFKPVFKMFKLKLSKLNKSNGFLFNLASFSARWLSLSSALLVNVSSYGYYVYFISIFLTFYFLNTIKNSRIHLN